MDIMKTLNHSVLVVLGLGWAMCLPVFAAETAQKPSTIVSLRQLKAQLASVQQQISTTMTSLERVKASGENEAALAKSTAEFTASFHALEAQVEQVRRQAVACRALAAEHFEAWQRELNEIQNSSIREKAQTRFSESKEQFEKIIATAEEAKKEAQPLIAELKDIATYLEIDPTPKAAKTLSSTIWKAGNKSHSVNGSIADVNEQIDRTMKMLPKS